MTLEPGQQRPQPSKPAGQSGPESLDEILSTTKPRGWIALAAVLIVVVLVGVWSVIATLPQQLTVNAAVSVTNLRTSLVAPEAGTISVQADVGDTVKKGDEIALITTYADGKTISVAAPSGGIVDSILVNQGQGVEPGTQIGTVLDAEGRASEIRFVTFLPANEAILFDVGDEVEVIVTNVETSKRAAVKARVVLVGASPADVEFATVTTGSPSFARELSDRGGGVVYEVRMSVQGGPKTVISSEILPGEIVEVVNTYDEPHPIELLFGGR